MKKLLLSLCCAATMLSASAEKVTFTATNAGFIGYPFLDSQYKYNPEVHGQLIQIPMSWSGATQYTDAFNMYITGTRNASTGAIYLANSSSTKAYIQFYPVEGVTITKIEFRMIPNTRTAEQCALQEATQPNAGEYVQSWEGEMTVSSPIDIKRFNLDPANTAAKLRLHAITVEYKGTPTRCAMPVINHADDYVLGGSDQLTFTCPTEGAKIWYSLSSSCKFDNSVPGTENDEGFIEWDGTPITLDQDSRLSVYATKDGIAKSGLYQKWYFAAPEESHHAVFSFFNPSTLNPAQAHESKGQTNLHLGKVSKFTNNGIGLKIKVGANTNAKGCRLMATDTNGYLYEARTTNNNELILTTDNPENTICKVLLIGWNLDKQIEMADTETEGVKYPGTIASNAAMGTVGQYYQEWTIPDDYEGDALKELKFKCIPSNTNNLLEMHVWHWGDAPSGIGNIAVDNDENAPVEYFNLQGVRVSNPENGLYIKRQGNKATKVYIK